MQADTQIEVEKLSDALIELAEEIDLAGDDDATAEEIQETRDLADEVLSRYRVLLTRVEGADRTEVQRSIGLKVAKIEGLLTTLPGG
jgi:phosphopantothenate synthetase